jgi:hypothetical protein
VCETLNGDLQSGLFGWVFWFEKYDIEGNLICLDKRHRDINVQQLIPLLYLQEIEISRVIHLTHKSGA